MKCSKCGEEIKIGSVYCQHCGEPAQIVPDYNVLEDDIIVSYLNEKKDDEGSPAAEQRQEEPKSDNKKKTMLLLIVGAVILLIGVCIGVLTSYSHCISKGKQADGKGNYTEALTYYEKAIVKKPDRSEAYRLAGADLILLEDYDKAEEYLLLAVEKDPKDLEAYEALLRLYLITGDHVALEELKVSAVTPEVRKLFEKLLVTPPKFSEKAGDYSDDMTLELSCDDGDEIFYTTDGSDPIKKGNRYDGALKLTEGSTTVKAVCKNRDGTYSMVMEGTYEITYEKPGYPEVSPASGDFTAPASVQVTIPEGCTVYYTWDGSKPTKSSAVCTGLIDIPEGNNILSLMLEDEHGLCSDILQCNYRYIPQ